MSTPMATTPERVGLFSVLLGALAGWTVAVALKVLALHRITAAARWFARRCRRSATHQEVLRALAMMDAGARFVPFRVACLERSLGVLLITGSKRLGVTWCQGVRTPPFASHAWVELLGQPIGEPDTTATYHRLLVISPVTATKGPST